MTSPTKFLENRIKLLSKQSCSALDVSSMESDSRGTKIVHIADTVNWYVADDLPRIRSRNKKHLEKALKILNEETPYKISKLTSKSSKLEKFIDIECNGESSSKVTSQFVSKVRRKPTQKYTKKIESKPQIPHIPPEIREKFIKGADSETLKQFALTNKANSILAQREMLNKEVYLHEDIPLKIRPFIKYGIWNASIYSRSANITDFTGLKKLKIRSVKDIASHKNAVEILKFLVDRDLIDLRKKGNKIAKIAAYEWDLDVLKYLDGKPGIDFGENGSNALYTAMYDQWGHFDDGAHDEHVRKGSPAHDTIKFLITHKQVNACLNDYGVVGYYLVEHNTTMIQFLKDNVDCISSITENKLNELLENYRNDPDWYDDFREIDQEEFEEEILEIFGFR